MITSESDLINKIKNILKIKQNSHMLIEGIGDDCAVYKISVNKYGLFSTDTLVNNVHFRMTYATPQEIGFKSMASNISDIFAMGGDPVLALVSLGIPQNFDNEYVEKIYEGMAECANLYNTFIAGGDTTSSDCFFLSISIYGETSNPIMRDGANIDDYIYITGQPGGSQTGLEVLNGTQLKSSYPQSVKKHLSPELPYSLLPSILNDFEPTAMIDISDGLISDLNHICNRSQKGFSINADKLPLNIEVEKYAVEQGKNLLKLILTSGEEYELLFTSQKKIHNHENITLIGKVTPQKREIYSNGKILSMGISGYDHFKRT